jgi:hypothetical protein
MSKKSKLQKLEDLENLNDFRDRFDTTLDELDEMANNDMGWFTEEQAKNFHNALALMSALKDVLDEQMAELEDKP